MSDDDTERQTATCDNCGYTRPRKGDADDGEKAVVWFEDTWMCQECKYHDDRSFGGPPSGSRTPRRGGMGTGGLGRRER
jgi:rubredoxin